MRSEKGQAAVEFALVLPILLLLILGIADFGRILYSRNYVTTICEQTARHVSINKTLDDEAVLAWVKSKYPTPDIQINDVVVLPAALDQRIAGTTIEVDISCSINYITPFISSYTILGPTYDFTIISKYRIN